MNNKFVFMVAVMLLAGCLGGCQKQQMQDRETVHAQASAGGQTGERSPEGADTSYADASQSGNPVDGDQLFAGCTQSGTVTEFSSTGCKITPTIQEGNVAYEAAPGYEEESELIHVIYDEACSFQISNVNILDGSVAYDSAAIEDVKKQTHLIIYGAYDGENNLIADHIYIYRSTEG